MSRIGCAIVVSHDRYFLNRVCTGMLAFEGDEKISYSVGNYDYYLEKKKRAPEKRDVNTTSNKVTAAAAKPARTVKLSWKEERELEGMETKIHAVESDIARIEGLFATPDFHREHGAQTNQLTAELALAKENVVKLYARWEELEKLKTVSSGS